MYKSWNKFYTDWAIIFCLLSLVIFWNHETWCDSTGPHFSHHLITQTLTCQCKQSIHHIMFLSSDLTTFYTLHVLDKTLPYVLWYHLYWESICNYIMDKWMSDRYLYVQPTTWNTHRIQFDIKLKMKDHLSYTNAYPESFRILLYISYVTHSPPPRSLNSILILMRESLQP